jgi:hypothetical protein
LLAAHACNDASGATTSTWTSTRNVAVPIPARIIGVFARRRYAAPGFMEGEDTYSPAEASRVLGLSISARCIRHMIQAREPEGEGDKGGRWRIPRRAIHRLLAERRELEWLRAEPQSTQ